MRDVELSEFLAARLDEDEAAAKATANALARSEWESDGQHAFAPGKLGRVELPLTPEIDREMADHIARHDPARVLAEVAAKRAILAQHQPDRDPADKWYGHDVRCAECGGITGSSSIGERGFQRSWPCATVRALAAIWASHADYDPAWAPE